MNDSDFLVFSGLFKDAYLKCFGETFKSPMTETESKIFCNKILDQTGLSIGWKSVKNYSFFIVEQATGKEENPSVATLDTFARYVLGAPYSTEIQRKNNESHYPYWFLYKEKLPKASQVVPVKKHLPAWAGYAIGAALLILLLLVYFKLSAPTTPLSFTDNFNNTNEASMLNKGWLIKSKDAAWWNKRSVTPGALTLFTLRGDNWPDTANKPEIRNLLLRKTPSDCFTAEVHLRDFRPDAEWQQAGVLLLEDTLFTGKSLRLSIAFNDFFGAQKMPKEIYIQAISSLGSGFGKPEEFAHRPIFYPDSSLRNPALLKTLETSSLRIEKQGKKFRFLYSGGYGVNGAFKEIAAQEFDVNPVYIGIFAIKGFTDGPIVPAKFTFFKLASSPCN